MGKKRALEDGPDATNDPKVDKMEEDDDDEEVLFP